MRKASLIFVLAVGCHYSPGDNPGGDGPVGDDDAPFGSEPVIPADAQACFGSGAFVVCIPMQPTMDLDLSTLSGTDRDTGEGESTKCLTPTPPSWATAGQRDACVIVAHNITLPAGATVDFDGGRPLVLVATGTLTISGTLDLSSKTNGNGDKGPDASPGLTCDAGNGNSNGNKGGGGGGGGFGTAGMVGGSANGASATAGTAGNNEPGAHDVLRGGCRGGTGSPGGQGGSTAGQGGGAAFLVGAMVIVDGTINASGAGGGAGQKDKGGGGGGGAGGMIVIDGTTVMITGTLLANGGGGGGGAEASHDGGDGGEAIVATPTVQALGGVKGDPGPAGPGGKGGASSGTPEAGGSIVDGGGGGGGGGLGVIRMLHGTIPQNNVSPTPTT